MAAKRSNLIWLQLQSILARASVRSRTVIVPQSNVHTAGALQGIALLQVGRLLVEAYEWGMHGAVAY